RSSIRPDRFAFDPSRKVVVGSNWTPSKHRRTPLTSSVPDPATAPHDAAQASAARLAELTGAPRHDVAVVLGSGWKPAADQMGEVVVERPLAELGGFPDTAVQGHGSTFRSVDSGDRR